MSDLNYEPENRIEALVRRIILVFGIFTLAATCLRLIGLPQAMMGFMEVAAFRGIKVPLSLFTTMLGWKKAFQMITIGGWLYILLPVAIFGLAIWSRVNELCRAFLMVFSVFTFVNHIFFSLFGGLLMFIMLPKAIPLIVIPTSILVGMVMIFRWCRELGRLRDEQDERIISYGEWTMAIVVVAFVLFCSFHFAPYKGYQGKFSPDQTQFLTWNDGASEYQFDWQVREKLHFAYIQYNIQKMFSGETTLPVISKNLEEVDIRFVSQDREAFS